MTRGGPTRPAVGAVIVAAGSGTRMGRPKQFLPLCGLPVCEWALKAFLDCPEVVKVALVLSPENIGLHGARLAGERVAVVPGGATRMGSVRNGFAALPPEVDAVAVHDGARPLVTPAVIRAAVEAALRTGAAVVSVPAKDTLKRAAPDGTVAETPDRAQYWQAQTPQAYRRGVLADALSRFAQEADATDESQLVERTGQKVSIVEGSYENIKVTTPEDLVTAEAFLSSRLGRPSERTGFGYDIHRLVEGRPLMLAGVEVPHTKGLLGHSDGDAALHAACDAVLGAMGDGEIGIAFPPSDPRFKGLDSRRIVEHVLEKAAARGAAIEHLDVTLVAEEPKLKPHYGRMADSLAACFRLERGRVNLKAKSHEGLGEIGRGEAIACYAVATVRLRSGAVAPL
ncbi:MAG: 2-C-methyl-D-erythritol 4-phosphate cytidylyltransferase [Elusimicrobia bacterium]|nr:2-C-methyl-D-erythritol 4-phosphate cytidylyltransferase [Elusimicrobiota bacterium]